MKPHQIHRRVGNFTIQENDGSLYDITMITNSDAEINIVYIPRTKEDGTTNIAKLCNMNMNQTLGTTSVAELVNKHEKPINIERAGTNVLWPTKPYKTQVLKKSRLSGVVHEPQALPEWDLWDKRSNNYIRDFTQWLIKAIERSKQPRNTKKLLKKTLLMVETLRAMGIKAPEGRSLNEGKRSPKVITPGIEMSSNYDNELSRYVTTLQSKCDKSFMTNINKISDEGIVTNENLLADLVETEDEEIEKTTETTPGTSDQTEENNEPKME